MNKNLLVFLIILVASLISIRLFIPFVPRNSSTVTRTQDVTQTAAPTPTKLITVVAQNLEIPWSMDFLPDGKLIFTERPGRVKIIDTNKNITQELLTIPEVKHVGEGGLLGIAAHPNFIENKYVYLYYTHSGNITNTLNRVVRYKLENNKLLNEEIIVDSIPGSVNHNGGRIKFGPDKFLYITTGDAQYPSLSQNKNSLAGKILRTTDDGRPVTNNPFENLTFSYGHRNPQGLAWDKDGNLWETEHGPSAHDEVNTVKIGGNYGWPEITGNEKGINMETPILQSGTQTWAPSGTSFAGDSLIFAGLRGSAVYKVETKRGETELKEYLSDEFGRIRDVLTGPDGFLYIATSNRDGRGTVRENDDKIIKIDPALII